MKIDVEGAEVQALTGAKTVLAPFRPDIFLALHGPDPRKHCCQLLVDTGYRLPALDGNSLGCTGELYVTQREGNDVLRTWRCPPFTVSHTLVRAKPITKD